MPNIMLKNDAGQRFLDVTEASGTGHPQKGHGVAFADLDHDGDEDVVMNVGGAVPDDSYDEALFENPGAGGNPVNRFLQIREGEASYSLIEPKRFVLGSNARP